MIATNSLLYSNVNTIIIKPAIIDDRQNIIVHPNYKFGVYEHDIALIKTSRPIEFLQNNRSFIVNSVCLPSPNSKPTDKLLALGWGLTDRHNKLSVPPLLQKVSLNLYNQEEGNSIWRSISLSQGDPAFPPNHVLYAGNGLMGPNMVSI